MGQPIGRHPLPNPSPHPESGLPIEEAALAPPPTTDLELLLGGVPMAVWLGAAFCSFAAAGFFSTLSASLLRALPSSVSDSIEAESPEELDRQLEGTESLSASASLVAYVFRGLACALLFASSLRATFLLGDVGASGGLEPWACWVIAAVATAAVGGPTLHLLTQSVPLALAQAHGERLLSVALRPFTVIERPVRWTLAILTAIRRVLLRAFRTPDADYATRRLVEGFRAMVEGAEFDGELGDETRELIANVIEFGAADAAEVMTPRTEIKAVDRDASLHDAIRVFATCGFSRIPVYEDTVDSIIGTLTALEAAKAVADDRVDQTSIADVMRPPLLVPETQPVPELLSAFRAERQKMAIVVDEYGGTAGIVTLADVIAEIVGHVQDEFEPEDRSFVRIDADRIETDASLHVSDVNEELDLAIPEEEDYETLAGFILAEFGRFPTAGESFETENVTFTVLEATDRRVVRVVLQRTGGLPLLREAKSREQATRPASTFREGRGTTIALRPDLGKTLREASDGSRNSNGRARERSPEASERRGA